MASDLRVPMAPILSAFGVPATVTRPAPDDDPIETTVAWVSPETADAPGGMDFERRERRYLLVLPLADVPTVPTATVIEAPEELGGEVKTWRTDGEARRESDHVRVWVVPVEAES